MDLSVITPTCQRPAQLANCLQQFRSQSRGDLLCEHLVVSDGVDPQARSLAKYWGARYIERSSTGGQWGSLARDTGIAAARGRYLCFWDDDNLYEPHALATLWAAAREVDIGVVQTRYRCRQRPCMIPIPRHWTGTFQAGNVDTMCICVRREIAQRESWEQLRPPASPATDWHWLHRLQQHTTRIRFVPITIGWHL
ncbi:MAG: glycosyltransferase family 2 protein [Planctomycetota bacterium]|nr:MAG: glycosyltransferase family 2 protein [Planctomycetota bacterium]